MEPIDASLLTTVQNLTTCLHSFGYGSIPDASPTSRVTFPLLPDAFKVLINQQLNEYSKLIPTRLPERSRRDVSLQLFNSFLRAGCMKLLDPTLLDHLEDDDICEVYSTQHQQIFRTLEFFRICNYDLLTLSTTPWHLLFHRSEEIKAEMMNLADYVLLKSVPKIMRPVRTHLIQECFGDHCERYVHSTKCGGCVVDAVTGQPKGYMVIIQVRKLDATHDSTRFNQ